VKDVEEGLFENTEEWTTIPFTADLNLIYTKTDGTGRPITKTFVGKAPCLDPSQITSFNTSDYLFPLEAVSRDTECSIDLKD